MLRKYCIYEDMDVQYNGRSSLILEKQLIYIAYMNIYEEERMYWTSYIRIIKQNNIKYLLHIHIIFISFISVFKRFLNEPD